jgi:autotransporter-associated beta strand protein
MTVSGTNYVTQLFNSTARTFEFDGVLTGPGWLSLQTQNAFFELYATNNGTGGIHVSNGFLRLTGPRITFNNKYNIIVHTNGVNGAGVVFGSAVPSVQLYNYAGPAILSTNVSITLQSAISGDQRTTFGVNGGGSGNVLNGPLVLTGDGNVSICVNNAADAVTINGPITNANFTGSLGLRGLGSLIFAGPIHTGGGDISQNFKNSGSGARTVTITSTNNQWTSYDLFIGTLILGAHDALCTTAPLSVEASLNLAGFNQTLGQLGDTASTGLIYNDAGSGQSVLTINGGANVSVWDGVIQNYASTPGGAMAVTVSSGTVVMNGANTYTGPTLVKSGAKLGGNGSLASAVTVQTGGILAPGASIGRLTISSNLVLQAGSASIFEVDGGSLTNDSVAGLRSVIYGGTLVVSNISATPLAAGESFALFSSTSYAGSFAAISPAVPGPGLMWDTSSLAVNGTLKIQAVPGFAAVAPAGAADIAFTIAGSVGSAYSLRFSSDATSPVAAWQVLTNGTILTSPFTIHDTTATNSQRFYRLSSP